MAKDSTSDKAPTSKEVVAKINEAENTDISVNSKGMFKGVVSQEFSVRGADNVNKVYRVGDTFETDREESLKSLISTKRIK